MSETYDIFKDSITFSGVEYAVHGERIYLDLIINSDDLKEQINSHHNYFQITRNDQPWRFSLSCAGVDLIVGFYPLDKSIYIANKNLSSQMLSLAFGEVLGVDDDKLNEHSYKIASLPVTNTPSVIEMISSKYDLPNYTEDRYKDVFKRSDLLVSSLKKNTCAYKLSLFEKVSDHALGLSANFELIRIHLLKFLAILPCLDHDKDGSEVKRVFLEMLRRLIEDSNKAFIKKLSGQKKSLPSLYVYMFRISLWVSQFIPTKPLAAMIKFSVSLLAKRFIAGEDIQKAKSSLSSLLDSNRDATLDQLGELIISPKEADEYKQSVLDIITGIGQHIPKGARNGAGINRSHVSIKVSALGHDFKPEAFDYVYEQVSPRLIEILLCAKENDVFINIDAEHYHFRDLVFNIYKKTLLDTNALHDYKSTGIVVQAYLRDALIHLREIIELAKARSINMPIRLVKGAYWDAETIESTAHSFDAYQFLNKEETDLHFRQILEVILRNGESLSLALASHNILDHCFGESLRDTLYPDAPVIEHQCLHMTYEGLSVGLEKMGWVVRNYIPIGNLLIGMAYLVRRVMENSSQVGILTIMRSHKKEILNTNPYETLRSNLNDLNYVYDSSISKVSIDFFNINPLRPYKRKELDVLNSAIKTDYNEGECTQDTFGTVEKKIDKLLHSESMYRSIDLYKSIIKLSDLLVIHRPRLCALIMHESGKTLVEAVADVDEAIDFINFYLREELKSLKITKMIPLGVMGVIAPWNFPLAIACGMSIAALVTGNKVILKPSECTPLIIIEFIKLCRLAGINSEYLEAAYGGGDIGKFICEHDKLSGTVFTGSKKVGLEIFKQTHASYFDSKIRFNGKICISEMGGKNAIIVTNNCELDETLAGIIYSSFAHAGQKCSAASRIIVDSQIKEKLITRLKTALESIEVGCALDPKTYINPLIRSSDKERILELMPQIYSEGGIVHLDRSKIESDLNLVGPVIVELSKKQSMIPTSFAQQELFAPIIHIIAFDGLDEAIDIFNSTEYALTGGIFCQSQDDIDYLSSKMLVGNVYVNRPSTGARVGIEPFGGFKLSGTGPKAGGSDYLISFKAAKQERRSIKPDNTKFENQEISTKYPSGLSYKSRKHKAIDTLSLVLEQYEVFSESIDQESKDIIKRLLFDIKNDEYDIDNKSYLNTKIPGQISISDKKLPIGCGLFITNHTRFDTRLFSMVIVNLVLGNPFSFICTTAASKISWDQVFDYIFTSGFSEFNAGIHLSNISALESVFNESRFIAYNNEICGESEFKDLFSQMKFSDFLPRVINVDKFPRRVWDIEHINLFVHARSFAINTMRHGAPLELDL